YITLYPGLAPPMVRVCILPAVADGEVAFRGDNQQFGSRIFMHQSFNSYPNHLIPAVKIDQESRLLFAFLPGIEFNQGIGGFRSAFLRFADKSEFLIGLDPLGDLEGNFAFQEVAAVKQEALANQPEAEIKATISNAIHPAVNLHGHFLAA